MNRTNAALPGPCPGSVPSVRFAAADALVCELGHVISEQVNERVYRLEERLRAAGCAGVTETVPGYTSLTVRFDLMRTDGEELKRTLVRLCGEPATEADEAAPPGRTVELAVRYGGEYGPDLPFVAKHAGLSEEEVIALHSGRTYRIYMLGFLPGFPYLGGLDERLFTPRRPTPRTLIPAGSVGIGGRQTGFYPLASPGGWQMIGRLTDLPVRPGEPFPYAPGDRIRFVAAEGRA